MFICIIQVLKFLSIYFIVREPRGPTVHPFPPPPPSPRNLPLWFQNVPQGVPNTISLVPRTAIGMHWCYSPLRKGTLLPSVGR